MNSASRHASEPSGAASEPSKAGSTGRHRVLALSGLGCTVACVAALHILRHDLDPTGHRLSEYANGSHGWLMTVAFMALGIGLVELGAALRESNGLASRSPVAPTRMAPTRMAPTRMAPTRSLPAVTVAATLALVAGVGAVLSGVFPTGRSSVFELVHSTASTVAAVSITLMALSRALPAVAARRRRSRSDRAALVAALAGPPLLVLSALVHGTTGTGLGQRLLWVALLYSLFDAALSPAAR